MQDSVPPPWLAGVDANSSSSTAQPGTARRGSKTSPRARQPRQNVSAIGGLRRHRAVPSHGAFKSAAAAYGTPRCSPPPRGPPSDPTPALPSQPPPEL